MEFTQLSLAGGRSYRNGKNIDDESETSLPVKRKWNPTEATSVDLQLKHPLPSDWEQCLDLQSGRMYYVNRKTSRTSWNRPELEQQHKLDLELNISTGCTSSISNSNKNNNNNNYYYYNNNNYNNEEIKGSSSSMVALACSNCHLLVILSRSSPSCPNCKYVHSLASSSSSSQAPINWPL